MSWSEFFILVVGTVFGSSVVLVIADQRLLLWNGEGTSLVPRLSLLVPRLSPHANEKIERKGESLVKFIL